MTVTLKKRHSFSLVEVLISFLLFSFLLSFFLGIFWHISSFGHSITGKVNEAEGLREVGARLQTIFANISFSKDFNFFYTKNEESRFEKGTSLIFSYDNGIDPSPYFSNNVVAKLFLDKKSRLVFAIFPNPDLFSFETPPLRYQVILENVVSYEMRFFLGQKKGEDAQQPPHGGFWNDKWEKDYEERPSIVSIKISTSTNNNEIREMTFFELIPKSLDVFTFT